MAARKLLYFDPSYGYPSELNSTDSATAPAFVATGLNGVGFDAGGNTIVNVLDPTAPQMAATKHYVDSIAQGISAVPSVRAMATSNVALSGTQTVDGVPLMAGDRVLLTGQTNGTQNGVWIVQTGAWTRPTASDDYASGTNATGRFVFIGSEGTVYANEGWLCVTSGNAIIDQTATKWTQFTAMGEIVAGNGLITSTASGNTVSVNLASPSGLQFSGGALDTNLTTTGGLTKSSSGLSVLLNSSANTIASDSAGLRTLGVPQGFTLGGVATSANVTAASLATLTGGTSSYADSLHQHKLVLGAQTVAQTVSTAVALNPGDPVQWSSSTANTVVKSDNSALATSQVIGVAAAAAAANSQVLVIKRGVAAGLLAGATLAATYYLAQGGGLTTTLPTTGIIVVIGRASAQTDLDVQPQFIGQRSSP